MIMDKVNESSYTESMALISKRKEKRAGIKGSITVTKTFRIFLVVAFLILAAIAISLGVTLSLVLRNHTEKIEKYTKTFKNAAVATDAAPCSTVGSDILKKGGSAVDAGIASLFCVGVINLHSTGIGGGGFLIYYNATNKSSTVIDFRERAPGNISNATMKRYIQDETSTTKGGLAVMVPGEIKGMYVAWENHGQLRWAELVKPSIKIARDGFKITPAIAQAIKAVQRDLDSGEYPGLQYLLKPNNKILKEGDTLKQPELAITLENIALNGSDYFYNSSFTEEMVQELQQNGSILTVEDFNTYTAIMRKTLVSHYDGMEVHGVPPPAGGAVLGLILNILDGYNFTSNDYNDERVLTYHRIVEAYKFAYGQRLDLGDPDFNDTINEIVEYMMNTDTSNMMRSNINDNTTYNYTHYIKNRQYNPSSHGTIHLSVYAKNGDALSLTSSINTYFGSLLRSTKSGIIFNNDMDDFSVPGRNNSFGYPPSPANYIGEKHRALSSMSPTIMTDNGNVVMIAGASGGSQIPTATTQVMLDVLSFGLHLRDAVPNSRLHHQLLPEDLFVEQTFPHSLVEGLKRKNHDILEVGSLAVVQAIYVNKGTIYAASDYRKGGEPDGY